MNDRLRFGLVLVALGVGWGATQPLGKIASSTGHKAFGLIFWQLVVCCVVLGVLTLVRGKSLPLHAKALRFYAVVAVLGTLVPNATFYTSVARLPSGIMSILISMVPLLAFPIAVALRQDQFSGRRLAGLGLGLTGVALIALPGTSLPDAGMVVFLPLAMIGPLFYAFESLYVARVGLPGMDAVQAMFGASLAGLALCVPIVLLSGQWFAMPLPPGRPELALILSSALHALLYCAFVWLAATAGAVFAAQSAYLVTAAGMIWAMVLLDERFPPMVWVAAAVMLVGLSLVRPARHLADAVPTGPDLAENRS